MEDIKKMLEPRSTFRVWITRIVFLPIIIIPLSCLCICELFFLSINAIGEWVAFGYLDNPLQKAEYATFWRH